MQVEICQPGGVLRLDNNARIVIHRLQAFFLGIRE